MPKFLDAPSWYDTAGIERKGCGYQTLSGVIDFNTLSAGLYVIPYNTAASFTLNGLPYEIQTSTSEYIDVFLRICAQEGALNSVKLCIFENVYFGTPEGAKSIWERKTGCGISFNISSGGSYGNMRGWGFNSVNGNSIYGGENLYAPTTTGAADQTIQGNGTNPPTWVTMRYSGTLLSGTSQTITAILPRVGYTWLFGSGATSVRIGSNNYRSALIFCTAAANSYSGLGFTGGLSGDLTVTCFSVSSGSSIVAVAGNVEYATINF